MKKSKVTKKSAKRLSLSSIPRFWIITITLAIITTLIFASYNYLTQPPVIAGVIDDYTYNLSQKAAGVVTSTSSKGATSYFVTPAEKNKTAGQIQVEAARTLERVADADKTGNKELQDRAKKATKDIDEAIKQGTISDADVKKAEEKVATDDQAIAKAKEDIASKSTQVSVPVATGGTCNTLGSPARAGEWVMTGGGTDLLGYTCVQCNPQPDGTFYDNSKAESCGKLIAQGQPVVLGYDMDPAKLGFPKGYKIGSCVSNASGTWTLIGIGGKDGGGRYCGPDGKLYSQADKGLFDDAMNAMCSARGEGLRYKDDKCQSASSATGNQAPGNQTVCGKGFENKDGKCIQTADDSAIAYYERECAKQSRVYDDQTGLCDKSGAPAVVQPTTSVARNVCNGGTQAGLILDAYNIANGGPIGFVIGTINGITTVINCSNKENPSFTFCRSKAGLDANGNCIPDAPDDNSGEFGTNTENGKVGGFLNPILGSDRVPSDDVARTPADDVAPPQNPPFSTVVQVTSGAIPGCITGFVVIGPVGCLVGGIIGGYAGNVVGNAIGAFVRGDRIPADDGAEGSQCIDLAGSGLSGTIKGGVCVFDNESKATTDNGAEGSECIDLAGSGQSGTIHDGVCVF
ncbi:hypothetical protein KBD75_03910 [Candidatus Woesebacteria bacterium]|nr:hypothetical protein [Candidatus Woesebacteria bacterium]